MDYSSSAGPVQIVSITDDHKFVLDEKKLKDILYHKRTQGKKVSFDELNLLIGHWGIEILLDFSCVDCW